MKKKIAVGCFVLIMILLIGSVYIRIDKTDNNKNTKASFDISVTDLRIYRDVSKENSNVKDGHSLSLKVIIDNNTEKDFESVWFKVKLNEGTKPYIASQMIEWSSEEVDVTTKEKAQENTEKLLPWGFEHTWNMLLTTDEDLQEYESVSSNKIEKVLNTVTVQVFWKGGEQKAEFPVKVTDVEW